MASLKKLIKNQDYFGQLVSLNFNKKGSRFNTTFGGLVSIMVKMMVIWYLVVKVSVFLTTSNNVYSSQVTHANGDFDLP